MLVAIADQIGVGLDNADLARQQALVTEQLRSSEQHYRELFERAHDAIWMHDLGGNILSANGAR